jgi:hypothetical protein
MQFPNALEGVKKLYKAEIIALIGATLGVIAAILALVGAFSGSEEAGVGGLVGAGILVIVMAVLMIVAFIMNIGGLNKAKPDEENFKYALYAVLVGIIASALLGLAKEGSLLSDLGNTISNVCSFLSTWYVCTAFINLAGRLGNVEMGEKGLKARKMLMTVWIIGIILSILGVVFNLVGGSTVIAVVAALLVLAAAVVEIIAYVLYLKLLSKARVMLEA